MRPWVQAFLLLVAQHGTHIVCVKKSTQFWLTLHDSNDTDYGAEE